MANLSENYQLRKHFLESNKVPSQSLIKSKMTPALAAIYFNSMSPKLKVLAGLEPPMKGGGGDWYVSPKDLLEGRTVLKPIDRTLLSQLNYLGIDKVANKLTELRIKRIKKDNVEMRIQSDINWKNLVEEECRKYYCQVSIDSAKKNTERIQRAFREFTAIYTDSLFKIENMIVEGARSEIIKVQNEAECNMQDKLNTLLKAQAISVSNEYTMQLNKDKELLKSEFIKKIEEQRSETNEMLHDIKLEKRVTIEKWKQFLECQILACQVYVSMKEKEQCGKEIKISQQQHIKTVHKLKDEILSKNYEITFQIEKEKKQMELKEAWEKKITLTVKKFQQLVTYCLQLLPEHADFFINTEKLFLMQMNEAMNAPSAESIFEVEEEEYLGPKPIPRPFYLFCDKGEIPHTDRNLYPKQHTSASSAPQMPVIVVNKRCLYAACDNFEQFTNKAKSYFYGERGDDADIEDDLYEDYVPVKCTDSQDVAELQLESSLLQVLQQERPNVDVVGFDCNCKPPHCYCRSDSIELVNDELGKLPPPAEPVKDKVLTRKDELKHLREPKMQNYAEYIMPRRCTCAKTAKKHLIDNLPPYMRNESKFESAVIPNYEPCSLDVLKHIVKRARGTHAPATPLQSRSSPSKLVTRDVGTQYSCPDPQFDYLCNCFSDYEFHQIYRLLKSNIIGDKLYDPIETRKQCRVIDEHLLIATTSRHSTPAAVPPHERTQSFKQLLEDTPGLDELFKLGGRTFN